MATSGVVCNVEINKIGLLYTSTFIIMVDTIVVCSNKDQVPSICCFFLENKYSFKLNNNSTPFNKYH